MTLFIQALFSHIHGHSEPCVTLKYAEKCYILYAEKYSEAYLEPWHIYEIR